ALEQLGDAGRHALADARDLAERGGVEWRIGRGKLLAMVLDGPGGAIKGRGAKGILPEDVENLRHLEERAGDLAVGDHRRNISRRPLQVKMGRVGDAQP